jgi:hypothetical protein
LLRYLLSKQSMRPALFARGARINDVSGSRDG